MPKVVFTANLKRHVECPPQEVGGATVREALDQVFGEAETLRGYVLDDQARVRQHVMIFVDGQPMLERETLSDTLASDSEIYVMQALSGG